MNKTNKLPIVVLISGNGSNLQAMIDAMHKDLPINIRAVISNNAKAYGLERARQADIPAIAISHNDYATRDEFDQALMSRIDAHKPSLVVLAGFMRRLGERFVAQYLGHLINIHPSLLPKYPGLHTHQRAIEAGDKYHGASIHFVTEELDSGPVICQAKLTINADDRPETLQKRVQALEHVIYPQALIWFAESRIALIDHQVLRDGEILPPQGIALSPVC